MKKILTPLDLNLADISNVKLPLSSGTPSTLVEGMIVYDTANGRLRTCDGVTWDSLGVGDVQLVAVQTGDGVASVDNTDPKNPKIGVKIAENQGEGVAIATASGLKVSVQDGTTAQKGIVKLATAPSATVTDQAATPQSANMTIEKLATPESGFASTYVLRQGGVDIGEHINIPLDYLVKEASVKTCVTKGVPLPELEVGDKYIDFVINAEGGTETHLYIAVKDIAPVYTASDGILLTNYNFTNSGVRAVVEGSANGTVSVNTNGTVADVPVKGLGSAAYTASTDYLAVTGGVISGDLTVGGLITGTFSGTVTEADHADEATKTQKDYVGQVIHTTYIKEMAVINDQLVFTKGDGAAHLVSLPVYTASDGISLENHNFTNTGVWTVSQSATNGYVTVNTGGTTDDVTVYILPTATTSILGGVKVSGTAGLKMVGDFITNTGVRSIATGGTNGTITIDTNGTTSEVGVKGLGSAAYTDSDAYMPATGGTITGDAVITGSLDVGGDVDVTGMINGNVTGNLTGTATNATKDASGQTITSTYIKGLSASGKTVTITKGDGTTSTFNMGYTASNGVTLTGSNFTNSGVRAATASSTNGNISINTNGTAADVTVYTLPTAGSATKGGVVVNGNGLAMSGTTITNTGVRSISTGSDNGTISVNTNGTAANVSVKGLGSAAYTNTSAYLSSSGGTVSGNLTVTGTITGSMSGTASKATADGAGNTITSTYIKGLSASGKTITITKGDGTTSTITTQDTTYTGSGGITLSGTNFTNSGVRAVTKSSTNGYVNVNTNGTAADVQVYSLPTASTSAIGGVKLGGGTANFLRADGTWAAPPAGAAYTASNGITLTGTNFTNSGVRSATVSGGTLTVNTNGTSATYNLNTTGSTNSTSKLFVVGATSQAATPQTYSNKYCYVNSDNNLYAYNARTTAAAQVACLDSYDFLGWEKTVTTATISDTAGRIFNIGSTSTVNVTAPSHDGACLTILTTASSITWSGATITWKGGSAPTLGSSGINIITLLSAGGAWYGA